MIEPVEALRLLGKRSWLSHEAAARMLGIELPLDDGRSRITVPRNASRRSLAGWDVVRADVAPLDVVEEDGLRCTGVARTVHDLARVLPLDRAVAAADSALRQGHLHPDDLLPLARAYGRGAAALRTVAQLADPVSGSVLESLLRMALREAALPAPRTQFRIYDERDAEVARVDFCWPAARLIVEADGFAFHSARDDYRRDRNRTNELVRLGWWVLRFTWEDVTQRPGYVVGLVRTCLQPSALRSAA